MDLLQVFLLSVIQGFTEFLPISSSAHLIIVPKFLSMQDQGLAFDVVVHLGTLVAIIYYYRETVFLLLKSFFQSIFELKEVGNSSLAWKVFFSTIPVGIIGILSKDFIESSLRSEEVIAYTSILFGLLLGLSVWVNNRYQTLSTSITWSVVFWMSLFQAVALIPGTSRSGIVITAALLIGLSRDVGVKFAFLMAIPIIALSSGLIIIELFNQPEAVDWIALIVGFVISALTAYLTVYYFIKLLNRIGFMPYVWYRIILGILILASV
jgi:undecaprenyl-diphosphatase